MSAVQTPLKNERTEDTREYMELLKALDDSEKLQVKGIMIGIQMSREANAQKGE